MKKISVLTLCLVVFSVTTCLSQWSANDSRNKGGDQSYGSQERDAYAAQRAAQINYLRCKNFCVNNAVSATDYLYCIDRCQGR